MGEFKTGDSVSLNDGKSAEIVSKLGEGGQGIVYSAVIEGKPYALKWYTCEFRDKNEFIKNLRNNIEKKQPDSKFLWPLYFVNEQNGSFGYVMDLRPKEYADFSDILTAKVKFTSMEIRILAALNFVSAFRSLHRKGFSYQDLNDGNFFIDVQTGDVLVCDNDNVTGGNIRNPGGVGGKPGYMAPEVVTGQEYPNTLSDYYSLAVILFKLFIMHDPLMGALYHKTDIMGPEEQMELYGRNPVFIFDPHNDANRPTPEVDKPALKLWPLYPKLFQDAFIKTFVDGMKNPLARLPDNEWLKILIRLRDEYSICPDCKELLAPWSSGSKIACQCGRVFNQPPRLCVGQYKAPLFEKQKLYACHTTDCNDDYAEITGEVVTNKSDPSKLGIRNLSGDIWIFKGQNEEIKSVAKNAVIPVFSAHDIQFRKISGVISDGKEALASPLCLFVKSYQLPLVDGQTLFACHTTSNDDASSIITGKVTSKKSDPNALGIRNLSNDEWVFIAPTGERKTIHHNEVMPIISDEIKSGIMVNFKGITGRIARK